MGPSEFEYHGFMKDWSAVNELQKITVPTLLINGVNEGAADESLRKFNEGIAGSQWVKFEESRHFPHYEEREKFLQTVANFLKANKMKIRRNFSHDEQLSGFLLQ